MSTENNTVTEDHTSVYTPVPNTLGVEPDRKMAWVVRIKSVTKHPEADRLYIIRFESSDGSEYGWQCVTNVSTYKVGDLSTYISLDSIPDPNDPMNVDTFKLPGFNRIKTIKLRGEYSQGMLVPMDHLTSRGCDVSKLNVDDDVTKELGVRKYVSTEEATQYDGTGMQPFPTNVPKTDEERLQNIKKVLDELLGRKITKKYEDGVVSDIVEMLPEQEVVITQKADGTSMTITLGSDGKIAVCSRNYQLTDPSKSNQHYFEMCKQYNLETVVQENPTYAIQGEVVGEGIQQNPLKLKGKQFLVFNVYNTATGAFLHHDTITDLCNKYKLHQVTEVYRGKLSELPAKLGKSEPLDVNFLVDFADSQQYGTGKQKSKAEGIVVKTLSRNVSFKVISRAYLEKQK